MKQAEKKRIGEAHALVAKARAILEEVQTDLQAAFDEKSERWQDGDKGEAAQEEITNVEEMIATLEDAENTLDGLTA